MKTRDWIAEQLASKGLWPKEAEKVIETMINGGNCPELVAIFGKDIGDYDEKFKVGAMLTAKAETLAWLDENEPKHFARPEFMTEKAREEFFAGA